MNTKSIFRRAALCVLACGAMTTAGIALFTSCAADDLPAAPAPGENFPQDSRVRISTSVDAPASSAVLTRADDAATLYTGTTLGLFIDYGTGTAAEPSEDPYNRFNVKWTQTLNTDGTPDGNGWTQDLTAPDYADLAQGEEFQSSTTALWKNTSTPVATLYAYAPYVPSAEAIKANTGGTDLNRQFLFSIPTDQTDGIAPADLVTGKLTDFNPYTSLNPKQAVDITLKHQLVKFTVAVTLGNEFEDKTNSDGKAIEVESMTLHYSRGEVAIDIPNDLPYFGADAISIDMHRTDVTDGTTATPAFEAICFPRSDKWKTVGTKLLTLTLNNGKSYTYTMTREVAIAMNFINENGNSTGGPAPGSAFRLNLKVGKDKLEIADTDTDGKGGVTVVPWDSASQEITGGEAEPVWDISGFFFDESNGAQLNEINDLISEHVQNGKLTLIGSFGDDPQAAHSNFAGLARYIRENTDGSQGNIVTELDFSGTTGVTTIGWYCYGEGTYDSYNCNLNGSKLVSVKLPASVTTLGPAAFLSCTALTTVTAATGGDAITVGDEAFSGCTALTKVDCPNVTSLGYGIFAGCTNLTDIYLTAETFSYVRSYTPSNRPYDPFIDIKNRGSVTLHLNASQVGNIAQNTSSDKWEWKPVAIGTEATTGLQEPVDLSGFKAVYCGDTKVYSAD